MSKINKNIKTYGYPQDGIFGIKKYFNYPKIKEKEKALVFFNNEYDKKKIGYALRVLEDEITGEQIVSYKLYTNYDIQWTSLLVHYYEKYEIGLPIKLIQYLKLKKIINQ